MRIYCLYTPSHERMFKEFFRPSLVLMNYDVIVRKIPQISRTGEYRSPGFSETTKCKVEMWIEAIEKAQEDGEEYLVFSDVDIQFFGNFRPILEKAIQDCDIVAQSDAANKTYYCTGFFICRANDAILTAFRATLDRIDIKTDDQYAFNQHGQYAAPLRIKCLNQQQFWSPRVMWNPTMGLKFNPYKIIMHHANWTYGIWNKEIMLDRVRQIMKQARKK